MSIAAADNLDLVLVDTDFFLATINKQITKSHNTSKAIIDSRLGLQCTTHDMYLLIFIK